MKATVYNDDIDLYVSSEEMLSLGWVKYPGTPKETRPKIETTTKSGEKIILDRGPTQHPDGIAVTRNGNEFLVRFRTSLASYFIDSHYRQIITRYGSGDKITLYNSDFLSDELKLLFDRL